MIYCQVGFGFISAIILQFVQWKDAIFDREIKRIKMERQEKEPKGTDNGVKGTKDKFLVSNVIKVQLP